MVENSFEEGFTTRSTLHRPDLYPLGFDRDNLADFVRLLRGVRLVCIIDRRERLFQGHIDSPRSVFGRRLIEGAHIG